MTLLSIILFYTIIIILVWLIYLSNFVRMKSNAADFDFIVYSDARRPTKKINAF